MTRTDNGGAPGAGQGNEARRKAGHDRKTTDRKEKGENDESFQ